jgi:hypothetical protein
MFWHLVYLANNRKCIILFRCARAVSFAAKVKMDHRLHLFSSSTFSPFLFSPIEAIHHSTAVVMFICSVGQVGHSLGLDCLPECERLC